MTPDLAKQALEALEETLADNSDLGLEDQLAIGRRVRAAIAALRSFVEAQPVVGELTDEPPYYEAMEAMRRGLNELPRYSFLLDEKSNVCRVPDRTGRWIEWQSAHELFDPVMVDALIAKMLASNTIKKATGENK